MSASEENTPLIKTTNGQPPAPQYQANPYAAYPTVPQTSAPVIAYPPQVAYPPQAYAPHVAPAAPLQPTLYVLAPQGSYAVPGHPNLFAIPQGSTLTQPQQVQVPPSVPLPHFVSAPQHPCAYKARNLALASLILYIVGYFTFLPMIASFSISLHMVRKGYIKQRKSEVIAFSVLELIAWLFVASFSWFFVENCDWYNSYYQECYTVYLGWIAFVVFGVFELAFGIPRVIFTWKYDCEQPSTLAIMPMGSHPGYYNAFA